MLLYILSVLIPSLLLTLPAVVTGEPARQRFVLGEDPGLVLGRELSASRGALENLGVRCWWFGHTTILVARVANSCRCDSHWSNFFSAL